MVTHPSYVVSGQMAGVTLTVGIQAPNKNFTIGLNDVVVEVRQPLAINETSGVVGSWAVLGSAKLNVNQNFSGTGSMQSALNVGVPLPPSNGPADLFVPASAVAFNGVADITVYQKQGDTTSSSPQSVSLVDSVTYYRTQLSTVASTSAWVTYQLLAGLAVAALIIRTRSPPLGPSVSPYSIELRKFKAERVLARLEEMRRSGKIGQSRYDEMKQDYQNELGRHAGPPSS